jgi:hypothetical protein
VPPPAPSGRSAHDDRTPCKAARPPQEWGAGRRSFHGSPVRLAHPKRDGLPRPGHGERSMPHARRRQHRSPHSGRPPPSSRRPHYPRLLETGELRIPSLLRRVPGQCAVMAGDREAEAQAAATSRQE